MAAIPQNLLDEIRDLKRRVRAIEGRAHIRPAMDRVINGTVLVGEGGTLQVDDTDGSPQLFVGGISPAHPDGTPQRGFLVYREDGSLAMSIATHDESPQALVIQDAQGRDLFAEDTATGGLAEPKLALLPPQPTDFALWPHASESSWTTVARSYHVVQHPKVRIFMTTLADAGTVGEFRLIVEGLPWGPVVPAGTVFDHTDFTDVPFHTLAKVEVEGRVTEGTGEIYAQVQLMYGCRT